MVDSDNYSRKPLITYDLGPIDERDATTDGVPTRLTSDWLCPDVLEKLTSSIKDAYENEIGGLSKTTVQLLNIPSARELSVGARRALLSKYAVLSSCEDDANTINETWNTIASDAIHHVNTTKEREELMELLQTAKSNGRTLKWTLMDILPGSKFKLHAHANIELVYCLAGALHEIRMNGEPITKTFPLGDTGETLKGPNLQDCTRPWYFGTLAEGSWLVNEVGSIHKSFVDCKKRCVLLALWSEHANIASDGEPRAFNVDAVIDKCCADDNAVFVGEIFLPESERIASCSGKV